MNARLPPTAAAIMNRIALENEQLRSARRTNAGIARDLKDKIAEAETRLATLEEAKRRGQLVRETFEYEGDTRTLKRVADDSELTAVRDEVAGLKAQHERITVHDTIPRMTVERLRGELDPHSRYEAHAVIPRLKTGETLEAALSRYRADISEKREERKALTRAPRTKTEVREKFMSDIRGMAARGCPKVLASFQGREPEWPVARVPNPGSNGFAHVMDGAALVAWLFQSELERKVDQLLEVYASDDALSESEQREALEAADAELLTLYREEAATVENLVSSGGNAFHLADRPAVAVLGIRAAA